MTQCRTFTYSTASFSASLWVQSLQFWWPCTRRHPARCALRRAWGAARFPAFVVQRGVAQGCPLSPLLHATFIDPVLQDMQSLSHPDMLWVGPAAPQRKLVGQPTRMTWLA